MHTPVNINGKKKELIGYLLKVGYTHKQIENLSKNELVDIIKQEMESPDPSSLDNDLKEVDDNISIENSDLHYEPTPQDQEWTEYIISQLYDDEMDGQYPRLEGLRRLASKYLGNIIEEGCDLIATPEQKNGYRACVKARIIFANGQVFEALADASDINCHTDFATYLVAMADTRAKGRAYRNALMLKRIIAAEESGAKFDDIDSNNKDAINGGQIQLIKNISNRLSVSVHKLLEHMDIEFETLNNGDINFKNIGYKDAKAVSKKLNDLRNDKDNIPKELIIGV